VTTSDSRDRRGLTQESNGNLNSATTSALWGVRRLLSASSRTVSTRRDELQRGEIGQHDHLPDRDWHTDQRGFLSRHTGFAQLTSARQSETLQPITGLGGRNEADCNGGAIGRIGRTFADRNGRAGADRVTGVPDRASGADRCFGAAPPCAPPCADLSARLLGARRLSPLQPGPERGARVQRHLRAGIPAKRHRNHAAHALLLAAGLGLHSRAVAGNRAEEPGVVEGRGLV
jgi:hypothetical protein